MKKTLLILGAGPGIGHATARRFGREGHRVVLAARNTDRLAQQAAALRAAGVEVDVTSLDVSRADQVGAVVRSIGEDLAVLHYNAGVLRYGSDGKLHTPSIDAMTPEEVESDIQVNITGALHAIQAALPGMAARRSGTILLTGGGLGVQPSAALLTLSVGKAGIRSMAQGLFEPAKAQGVHVATVTVATLVSPDSPQAEGIAEAFWSLHAQPQDAWAWETRYDGSGIS